MVREVADGGRWTLPGGWAEVNLTAAENVVKEMREESGFQVRVRKLAAVWDRSRQGHPGQVFSCCRLFFICDIVGGAATTSLETSEVDWFDGRPLAWPRTPKATQTHVRACTQPRATDGFRLSRRPAVH